MKPQKQQSVGVEITHDRFKILALGSGQKPVYASTYPNPGGLEAWAGPLRQTLEEIFGTKKFPQKLALTLHFQSQQNLVVHPSPQNGHLDDFLSWAHETHTGIPTSEFAFDYSVADTASRPTINTLAIRRTELEDLGSQLQNANLFPLVLDSSLYASVNAVLLSTKIQDFIILKIESDRSKWISVREGALQNWGDFSISLNEVDALYWKPRLKEKLEELAAQRPGCPIFITGTLLEDESIQNGLDTEFSEHTLLTPPNPFKLNPALNASYAAAWSMALRAGDEK